MNVMDEIAAELARHDLRRWVRFEKANGEFDCLRCYCGEVIGQDSEEAMMRHVASEIFRRLTTDGA